MDLSELDRKKGLLRKKRDRLYKLEMQAAGFSSLYVPPHISMEIDDLKKEIEALQREVEGLENDIGELEKNMSKGANPMSATPEPNGGWRDKPVILIAPAGLVLVIILLLSGIVPWPSGGEFFYQVRLKDEDTRAAIASREVIIEVDGRQFKANTGTDGLARVKIPSEFEGRRGKIIINVTGYEDKEQSIDVNDTGTSTTVLLTPVEEEGAEEEAEVMDEAEAP